MAWQVEEEGAPTEAPANASSWKEEQAPAPSGWLDTANDFGRAVSNAATFGMANRLKGYISGTGTDEQARLSEVARERSPYASVAGDVAGSLAIPGFGAEALAARLGGGALARMGAYGLTGAGTGAAQGAGSTYTGNPSDYVENAAIGGGIGGVLGAAGGAIFGRGPAVSRAAVPVSDELHNAGTANYGVLARSPAAYEPQALRQAADDVEQRLLADRYHWRDSPATWRAIEEMRGGGAPGRVQTGPNQIISPADLDFVRKGINKIPKTEATATDRASADVVRRTLDDFLIRPPAGAVLPGTERDAVRAAERAVEARGNWGAYKRTEKMDDLITGAQNTAGSTHSGLNLQNELRKGVRSFVKPKAGESQASKAGFNDAEVAALTNYTRGTNGTNVLRYVSNALGGGGGALSFAPGAVAGGSTAYLRDNPELGAAVGLGMPAAGLALRLLGNRRANNDITQLREMIARRSPLYDYRTSMSGMSPGPGAPRTAKSVRDAIATEILKQKTRPGEE